MQARFTGPQVAQLTGLPYASLAKYVAAGIVTPSVHKGEGSGSLSLWSFADLVAVASLGPLRPSPASAQTLRSLYEAWHQPRGLRLVGGATARAAEESPHQPALVVVADDGRVVFETEGDVTALGKKYGPRFYVIDATVLVETLLLEATMKRMMGEHAEPTRGPQQQKVQVRRRRRKKPALVREAGERWAKINEKKNARGT